MLKRRKKRGASYSPSDEVVMGRLFVAREPGIPMPEDLQELVYEALGCIRPEQRVCRAEWAYRGPMTECQYKLLGLLCVLNGLKLLDVEKNAQTLLAKDFLKELGFSVYDVHALNEIDRHTSNLDLLMHRTVRYMDGGQRMPLTGYEDER